MLNSFNFLDLIKTFIFLLVFLLLPGSLVFNLLFFSKKSFNYLEAIPLSFAFGLVLFGLIGFPAYYFHFSYNLFFEILGSVFIILLILNVILLFIHKIKFDFEKRDSSWIFVAVAMVLSTALVFLLSGLDIYGDRMVHTGIVRRLAESNLITPNFIMFKDVPDKIDSAYGYNIWYLVMAAVNRYSGIGVNFLWKYITIIMTPLGVLSFYFLARRFSKSVLFLIIAISIFFITNGMSSTGWEWRLFPYPDQIARNFLVPVILGLILFFYNLEKIDWKVLISICLMIAIVPLVHMFSAFYIAIVLVGILILGFLADQKFQIVKKTLLISLLTAAVALPIIYAKVITYSQIVPTSFGTANAKMIKVGNLYFVNPNLWSGILLNITIFGLILLVCWYFWYKKVKLPNNLLLCLALTVIPIVISFVPPLPIFLAKIVTSTFMARLSSVVPITLILALVIYELINSNRFTRKAGIGLVLVAFVSICIYFGVKTDLVTQIKDSFNAPVYFLYQHPVYDYIEQNIPSDAVIAADADNSYTLYARTNNYLIMIPQSHCPAIIDKKARLESQNILFSTKIGDTKSMIKKLKDLQVDYVLTEGLNENNKYKNIPKILKLVKVINVDGVNFTIYNIQRDLIN